MRCCCCCFCCFQLLWQQCQPLWLLTNGSLLLTKRVDVAAAQQLKMELTSTGWSWLIKQNTFFIPNNPNWFRFCTIRLSYCYTPRPADMELRVLYILHYICRHEVTFSEYYSDFGGWYRKVGAESITLDLDLLSSVSSTSYVATVAVSHQFGAQERSWKHFCQTAIVWRSPE